MDVASFATSFAHAIGLTTPDDDFASLPPSWQDASAMQGYGHAATVVGDAVTAPIKEAEKAVAEGLMTVLAWGGVLVVGALVLRHLER